MQSLELTEYISVGEKHSEAQDFGSGIIIIAIKIFMLKLEPVVFYFSYFILLSSSVTSWIASDFTDLVGGWGVASICDLRLTSVVSDK